MLGIFLDIETNGLNPNKQRILEIAFKIINVYTGDILTRFESIIYQPDEVWEKSNSESLQVNGFTRELNLTGRCEQAVARDIIKIFEKYKIVRNKAVFICQNPSFDRMFFSQLIDVDHQVRLNLPYHWLDLASMYWAFQIQSQQYTMHHTANFIPLSKDHIAAQCNLPIEAAPHRAMNGVKHLIECYEAVVGFPHKKDSMLVLTAHR